MTNVVSSAPIGTGATFATVTIGGVEYPVNIICKADGTIVDPTTTTVSGTVAVTGAFYQATQPVSGSVSVSNFPATQPVSGTVGVSGSVAVTGAVPANTVTSGTLSASDAVVGAPVGDGSLLSGASTVGSIVYATIPDGFQAWTLLIKGYVSGTIYTEASNNTTNGTDGDWVEIKGRRTGTAPGIESVLYAMVANGYYRGNAAGFKAIRARLIGGTGPTIQWQLSNGMGATFLNSGLPQGGSIIGKVGIDQTTPGNTNAVSLAAGVPVTTTMQSAAVAVGNGTTLDVNGFSTTIIELSGTFVATVTFEASIDDVTWSPLSAVQTGTNNLSSTATTVGLFRMSTAGIKSVRARISAYTSGSVTAKGRSLAVATAPKVVNLANGASVAQSGTWNIGSITTMPTTPVTGTFWQATQPVSLASTTITGSVAVTGPLTDTQLRATAVPVSLTSTTITGTVAATQSGTWNIGSITTLPALATGANVIGAVTQSGTWNVGSITTLPALVAGSAIIGKVGIDQTTVGTTNAVSLAQIGATTVATGNGVVGAGVQRVAIASDNTTFPVTATLAAGTAIAGKVGIDQTTPGTTNAVVNTPVTPTSSTTNSAATTNATSVKASAGTVWSIAVSNSGAAAAFLKIYNLAVAPTVGTSVPVLTIPIAASGIQSLSFAPTGIRLGTGIAFAITNLVADSDTTAVAASQVKVVLSYT